MTLRTLATALSATLALAAPSAHAGTTYTVAAAGDIAERCKASDSKCIHPKTAALVSAMKPSAVITMGDNQYDDAHLSDFKKYFDTTWGKFKSIMHPAPGNHESYDDTPEAGYKAYFGSIATPQGKTYYSWNLGNWHFIVLDSNEFVTHDDFSAAESAQISWLRKDLAANSGHCLAAYYHHPRFSSGDHGDNMDSAQLWQILVDSKVDLVLNGHDHDYERFVPQDAKGKPDPAGPVEIVAGNGGADPYKVHSEHATTAKLLANTFGVLRLTLTDNTFSTQLVGLDSKVKDASPTYTCHH
ncbi:hypothetical protein GCM10010174_38250 [Kutzneria viridogrisea]|uniref:Alkaline phosphatase n=2 Tax=Kutzneria TaxID=43356 RepID=W5W8I5_9PSEU|nr:alkaline phosphatase [Kutzneria albida DSM 43870]MBA8931970.1 hypothetical protein [Kutzneria viridogrisea]